MGKAKVAKNIASRAMNFLLSSCGIAIIYINSKILLETIIKRIKAQMFWKTTLIYSICRGIKKAIDNRKMITKLFIYYWGFCIIGFFVTLSIPDSYGGSFFNKVVILAALELKLSRKTLYNKLKKYIMEKQTLKLIQKN